MACNCVHMEREIADYRGEIEKLRELFVRRLTVDSETQDRRRREYNQALFSYYSDDFFHKTSEETYQRWNEITLEMVMQKFDAAVKDWRRTFCDEENCRRK